MPKKTTSNPTSLIAFEQQHIRRAWHNDEWWFAVSDVVEVLSESSNVTDYIKKMRSRDSELSKGWGQIVTPLSIATSGGKQKVNCANTKGILRIIQSIPSRKAEPFKQWLAQVGYERIQEIENPELATQRTRELYKAKGYDKAWIEKRMRGIAVRDQLTNEWDERGVKGTKEYAILTAEISQATFGLKPADYKKYKGLDKPHNLRDHMSDLELIFTMLGEAATTEIARTQDARGFDKNRLAAIEGGKVAGRARKQLEQQTGRKVITKENHLPTTKKIKDK